MSIPTQTQRKERHSDCRSFPPAAAAPGREPGATADAAASTSSPRGSLTAQTPHLRLPHPFCPGITPASPPQDRGSVKTRQPASLGRRRPAHAKKHTRNPSRRPSPRALRFRLLPARAEKSLRRTNGGAPRSNEGRTEAAARSTRAAPPRPAPPASRRLAEARVPRFPRFCSVNAEAWGSRIAAYPSWRS